MKRLSFKLITVLVLILFVFFGNSVINSQVKKIEKINPQLIQKVRPITIGPKIVMQRSALESPKGMKLYRIQALQVRPELIRQLGQKYMFKMAPVSIQDRVRKARIQVYASSEKEFTRLIVNEDRGHIDLMPDLEKIEKAKINLVREDMALNSAMKYVAEMQLIPQDISRFSAKKVITLSMSSLNQGGAPVVSPKLQSVLFQRSLEGRPVMGAGSQFSVNLGDNGNVEGFQRKWNQLAAEPSQGDMAFRSDQEVYDGIEQRLKAQIQGNVEIRVETPRLVYYGNDRQFVQPAYFFSAEIISQDGKGKAFYSGVVEALKNPPEAVFEPIQNRELPVAAAESANNLPAIQPPPPDDPTVCRYVVRDDSWDWVDDANDFKNGLINGHCGGCPAITFPQFYWNYPRLMTTQANYFANTCNITLVEGHGNHWLYTTRSNCCDVVYLDDAAHPGYGGNAGGQMAYLVLKGCDIIPSPVEVGNNWPNPWWRIFKGLHQAIGFRTTMYINDDISYTFGYYLGKNCKVLDSWFYATNSSASYQWNRFWGAHVTGYGAVVMIPGHEGDGIYYTAPAPNATSAGLTMWWQH